MMKLVCLLIEGLLILGHIFASAGCEGTSAPPAKNVQATVAAELAYAQLAVAVNPTPSPDAPRCGGTKFITHGDGHKTPCPGCVDCQSGASGTCQCGPGCKCREGWNPDCKCVACKCDPQAVAETPVPPPYDEPVPQAVCVHAPGHCPPCDAQPFDAPPGEFVIYVKYEDRAKYGIGEPESYPYWAIVKDGKVVRDHEGYLNRDRFKDFYRKQPFGTHAAQVASQRIGYPVRGGHWSHPDTIWNHLVNGHGYSPDFVRSLSAAEAESLHADDHEGRVKNGVRSMKSARSATRRVMRTRRVCPTCPN